MCKYRVRYFYSKGAFLVLVWTLLVTATLVFIKDVINAYLKDCDADNIYKSVPKWILTIPVVIGLTGTIFSGAS